MRPIKKLSQFSFVKSTYYKWELAKQKWFKNRKNLFEVLTLIISFPSYFDVGEGHKFTHTQNTRLIGIWSWG